MDLAVGKYTFEPVSLGALNLGEYYGFTNKSIFCTKEWLAFVAKDSGAEPLILRIQREEEFVGYFTGLSMTKCGVRIVASPFRGWSTCFMGFDMIDPAEKLEILPSLLEYLFSVQKCIYFEMIDRDISVEESKTKGFRANIVSTLELDITREEDEIFKGFKTDARNFIRQFARRGAVLEKAEADGVFAKEYYDQLRDVFAKQGLVPTYGLKKVENLLDTMGPTGRLLCLRVKDPEGNSIATSIFLGYDKKFFFWGGASYRGSQCYRPNEAMIWRAIQYWKKEGCQIFDMVGVREYKKKFGPEEKQYAKITVAKYPILIALRDLAEKLFFLMLRIRELVQKRKIGVK